MKTQVRHVDVEVPANALEASDCDPLLVVPSPLAEGSEVAPFRTATSILAIQIPDGTQPGCALRLHLGEGRVVNAVLPATLASGDDANLLLLADGSCRLAKRTTEHFFLVPEQVKVDEQHTVPLPDGTCLRFATPHGAAGEVVKFELEGCAWGIKTICKLPEPMRTAEVLDHVSGPYAGVLDVVRASGLLKRLHAGKGGTFHVSVPFCAGFAEHPAMGNFLAEHCLTLPGVEGVDVLATELFAQYSFNWAVAGRWFSKLHPRINLRTCVCDLSVDSLPEAQLFIAIHPEVTRGGCWFQIMGSIIRSCTGLCVIACFWETEKVTVLNMVEMYKIDGSTVEVHENPYYDTHEMPFAAHMRYIILILSPSSAAAVVKD